MNKMNNTCKRIKDSLQDLYDIPFKVGSRIVYKDPVYLIIPENDLEELFEVKITIKQNIRTIIEIMPQHYAARMLNDMHNADENQKHTFLEYIKLFHQRAKTDFYLNHTLRKEENLELWNEEWKQYHIRATQILDEKDMVSDEYLVEWAMLSVGCMMSLLMVENIGEAEKTNFSEGRVSQVLSNKYERNPANRELCLAANGYSCKICGFDFEKKYGKLGHNFIHVHHIDMVSTFGGQYYLDPIKDLIPVCPNCHAMLHRTNPPMQPNELKILIEKMTRNGDG